MPKKWYDVSRHIQLHVKIQYVKPTAQLLFKSRFPKGGPTCSRQVVDPRHQTPQGQLVANPETPLQNIQVEWLDFQKVDQHAGGKRLIHDTKRRKDNQLSS